LPRILGCRSHAGDSSFQRGRYKPAAGDLRPVGALLPGVPVLGERPQWAAFAGMALIFAGLAAVDGRLPARLRHLAATAAARRSVP